MICLVESYNKNYLEKCSEVYLLLFVFSEAQSEITEGEGLMRGWSRHIGELSCCPSLFYSPTVILNFKTSEACDRHLIYFVLFDRYYTVLHQIHRVLSPSDRTSSPPSLRNLPPRRQHWKPSICVTDLRLMNTTKTNMLFSDLNNIFLGPCTSVTVDFPPEGACWNRCHFYVKQSGRNGSLML